MKIHGWDYVLDSSNLNPIFYILPDDSFISYLSINGWMNVPVRIEGTGLYDGLYWIPFDRQPQTLWHIGFLPTTFQGYPITNGECILSFPHGQNHVLTPLKCVENNCC